MGSTDPQMSSYWIDYGFSFIKNQSQFRAPLGFQMAFAIVTLVLIQWCPESPRWLLSRGRDADAQAVLRQLSVEPLADRDAVVDAEFKQIAEWIAEEKAALVRDGKPISQFRACFTNGKDRYFHRLVLGMGSQFMQQLCGINAIAYYSAVIFEQSVGLARNTSLLLAGGNGIVNHLASIPPIFIIDRIGRRKLMIWSVAGQAVCMALMAGGTSRTAHGPGIVATTGIFFFSFFFASGLLSVPWLYPTEIAPLPIRTCSAALGSASNWIVSWRVPSQLTTSSSGTSLSSKSRPSRSIRSGIRLTSTLQSSTRCLCRSSTSSTPRPGSCRSRTLICSSLGLRSSCTCPRSCVSRSRW